MSEQVMVTQQDHMILKRMLEQATGTDSRVAIALRRKLAGARIVNADVIARDVVTISSRVAFCVDDGEEQTRVIVHEDSRAMTGLTLSLSHPRAIAMLGLRAGERVVVSHPDGRTETLTVRRVFYQPESAKREMAIVTTVSSPPKAPAVLRLLLADNDRKGCSAG